MPTTPQEQQRTDEPIKKGCVVFEYTRPELLGVVEEVEWRDERLRATGQIALADKLAKYSDPIPMVRVRWLTGNYGRVSANAPAGQNWSSALFLRVADPMTALAALAAEGRT